MDRERVRSATLRRSLRQRFGFNFYDIFVIVFCVSFAVICFYPMWYVLVASVTPYEEFVKGGILLWPTGGLLALILVFCFAKNTEAVYTTNISVTQGQK